jgi:DNA-binding transcriptional MocR family regulator
MSGSAGAQPRYEQVATDLRRRILAGEFPHHLPSERVLRGQYGVSQATLRPALIILDGEGLIVRTRGANHQVRGQPERILVYVDVPGPVEITAGVATEKERARLGLPPGAWVLRVWDVERVDADGQPTLWQVLPAATSRLRIADRDRPDPA